MNKERIVKICLAGTIATPGLLLLGSFILAIMKMTLAGVGSMELPIIGSKTVGVSIGNERFIQNVFPPSLIKQIRSEELLGWKFGDLGLVIISTDRSEVKSDPLWNMQLARR